MLPVVCVCGRGKLLRRSPVWPSPGRGGGTPPDHSLDARSSRAPSGAPLRGSAPHPRVEAQHLADRGLRRDVACEGDRARAAPRAAPRGSRDRCAAPRRRRTKFPVIDISRALRRPTAAERALRPHPATTFSRACVSAKRARSDAIANVQLNAISSAPETHAPFTAAIVGVMQARSAAAGSGRSAQSTGRRTAGVAPVEPLGCIDSLKSTPALNTGSVAVITTPWTSGSASASAIRSMNTARIGRIERVLRVRAVDRDDADAVVICDRQVRVPGHHAKPQLCVLPGHDPLLGVDAEDDVVALVVGTGVVGHPAAVGAKGGVLVVHRRFEAGERLLVLDDDRGAGQVDGPQPAHRSPPSTRNEIRGSRRRRAAFFVATSVRKCTAPSTTQNHIGNAIGMPSRRRLVMMPVWAESIRAHASSGVIRTLMVVSVVCGRARPPASFSLRSWRRVSTSDERRRRRARARR